ncbi:uncharacterized protein LOC126410006 [Nymphaea colorata]|nr:uncharacterized protein LOC126410006 [Nymphaea colorata]
MEFVPSMQLSGSETWKLAPWLQLGIERCRWKWSEEIRVHISIASSSANYSKVAVAANGNLLIRSDNLHESATEHNSLLRIRCSWEITVRPLRYVVDLMLPMEGRELKEWGVAGV